jgi:uncharacterized protein with GYD domain
MATFVMFGKYSQESAAKISAQRTSDAMNLIHSNNGKLVAGYALLGEHDLLAIVEFPGVEQAMKTSIALTKMLGVSFTTAPAVTFEEFDKLAG